MKYIKEFETLLKHDSPTVKKNIFKKFAEKLKKIIISLKELDELKGSSVKIYFDDSYEISITYRYNYSNIFKIRLLTYHRPSGTELTIILEKHITVDLISENENLYKIITSVLNKYEIKDDDVYWDRPNVYDIQIKDTNDLTILDDIITEIEEEFNVYINTKKFNI